MTDFWQAILYVHLLSMAFFVGGQLFLGLAVVPVERANPDHERMLRDRAAIRLRLGDRPRAADRDGDRDGVALRPLA